MGPTKEWLHLRNGKPRPHGRGFSIDGCVLVWRMGPCLKKGVSLCPGFSQVLLTTGKMH